MKSNLQEQLATKTGKTIHIKKVIGTVLVVLILAVVATAAMGCDNTVAYYQDPQFERMAVSCIEWVTGKRQLGGINDSGIFDWSYLITYYKKETKISASHVKMDPFYTQEGDFISSKDLRDVGPTNIFFDKDGCHVYYRHRITTVGNEELTLPNTMWQKTVVRNEDLNQNISWSALKDYEEEKRLLFSMYNISNVNPEIFLPQGVSPAALYCVWERATDYSGLLAVLRETDLRISHFLIKTGDEPDSVVLQMPRYYLKGQTILEMIEQLAQYDTEVLRGICNSPLINADIDFGQINEYCQQNPACIMGFICKVDLPFDGIDESDFDFSLQLGRNKMSVGKLKLI